MKGLGLNSLGAALALGAASMSANSRFDRHYDILSPESDFDLERLNLKDISSTKRTNHPKRKADPTKKAARKRQGAARAKNRKK